MTKTNERRKEQRILLDTLYFVNISFCEKNEIEDITCMVLDISSSGIMIALPPSFEQALLSLAQKVLVYDVPMELLEFLPEKVNGVVMWFREGLCGLAFEKSISDDY